ncbi:neutral sphingomyelinase [Chlorella sorokiniana]|uniref:Neutral sphingomyelinase n=1 Tax=Chlorella sorokiniana TaxID=3076 RepID=A0A2P6TNW0_CHLSO|nr:neutral sphingomyelinase [Chlorella sorokiniana]|eukprot:PRW50999.1 neutral sphingomyelinase [Chlorella sorokiniana]
MHRHLLGLLAAACLAALTLNPPLPRLPANAAPRECPAAGADMGSHDGRLRLRVVTLNTWGLWLVSRRRTERMAALADWLRSAECPADVVALQEVWVLADVERLRQAGAEGGALPHSFHYQSGALGSGLLLLSRYPIAEVAFHRYSARGDPAAVLQGDYYVGKGVGWAALQTPAGTLSVFLTHLSANYGQEWQVGAFRLAPDCRLPRDNLAGVRLLQVAELAAFVRARGADSPAGMVLAGDLNCAPDTLEFAMLKVLLPELRDVWAEAQPLRLGATANALESSFTTAGDNYLLLLGGMGAALGWAGVVLVGGFVARGGEQRALQQVALQLRLAVGGAGCKPFS